MNIQPNVPLKVDNPTVDGESIFVVWDGDTGRYARHPRRPGFWSPVPDGRVAESALKRRLSDTSAPASTWHRLEFDTWREAEDYAKARQRDGYGSYVGDLDRYSQRIVIEDPDFFQRFAMRRPLRILALDIEQRTDGSGFPPTDAPMVSIALSFLGTEDEAPKVTMSRTGADGEPDDRPVVAAWQDALHAFDPDIVVGFNVHYDLRVLVARSTIHGFPLCDWGRVDERSEFADSYTRTERVGKFYDEAVAIGGRITWDLRRNANPVLDYNLSGCKDFKLKTIAEFLDWPVIKEDTKNTLALWRDRPADLARYNANDADLVRRMVERYLPDRVRMAEFFGTPLQMTIDAAGGWSGTMAAARALFNAGIVSDGKNLDRHRQWLRRVEEPVEDEDGEDAEADTDDAEDWLKPQGAVVRLLRRGRFAPIWKVDYASLYPTVIAAVGCGPDNTRIIGTAPLGDFSVTNAGDVRTLSIPDAKYGHNWLIEVRGRSTFSDIVEARMAERLKAKYEGDETRATVLKTMLNALCFGVQGSLPNRYGVLPLMIIAMGVSRQLLSVAERFVGDAAVEVDTDGIYVTRPVPLNLLNQAANREAKRLGFKPRFKLDRDEYAAAWFHEPKQYLLLDKKGKFKRFGVAMKGSTHPAIFDIIIDRVGRALLTDGRDAALEVARRSLDFKAYKPTDFVQRAKLGQPIESYVSETKEVKIAKAYERLLAVPPTPGRVYEYIRTRNGNLPPTEEAFAQLDEWAYLDKAILTALKRLGFEDHEELGLTQRLKHAKARSKRPVQETTLAGYLK